MEAPPKRHGKLLTVDTGAGDSVCGADDAPSFPVRDSPEQKRGTHDLVAGRARVPRRETCSELHARR